MLQDFLEQFVVNGLSCITEIQQLICFSVWVYVLPAIRRNFPSVLDGHKMLHLCLNCCALINGPFQSSEILGLFSIERKNVSLQPKPRWHQSFWDTFLPYK